MGLSGVLESFSTTRPDEKGQLIERFCCDAENARINQPRKPYTVEHLIIFVFIRQIIKILFRNNSLLILIIQVPIGFYFLNPYEIVNHLNNVTLES